MLRSAGGIISVSIMVLAVAFSSGLLLARRSLAYSRTASTTAAGFQSFQQHRHQRHVTPFLSRLHHQPATLLHFSAMTASQEKSVQSSPIPMTLLSGFLGAGKTSALKNLLENNENLKIGVIVNDVASVNIDAKLVSGQTADMVELQNGCACCSLADELFLSVEKLLKGRDLDAIVVELSGVADPVAIKSNWRVAPKNIREMADVSRIVTLVDSTTFGTDYMTWDLARERKGWTDPGDDCSGNRQIAELLAEQVESADLILVNKVDLATEEEVTVAASVARALNDKADLVKVEYGRILPMDLIAVNRVATVEQEHSHSHEDLACKEPDCSDPSHAHSHSNVQHSTTTTCEELDCTDTSHDHSHDHTTTCEEPECTDPSHDHSHSAVSHDHKTSMDKLGISSFVYKAAVPFNPKKLMILLQQWPVMKKETLDIGLLQDAQKGGYEIGGRPSMEKSPFLGVIRSKGFAWFAPSKWSGANEDPWRHDTAMYWSHAGKQFGITAAGKWWGTVSKEQMKKFFADNMDEYDRIIREDFATEEWADRRQEIVFIGTNIDEDRITSALNDCLLTKREMKQYQQKLQNYLATINTLASGGSGLFDVGAIDHTDIQQ